MIVARSEPTEPDREQDARVSPTRPAEDHDAWHVAAAIVDPRAFAPLYERYFDAVLNYCYRRIDNRDDAVDATSQVFTNALHGLANLRFDPDKPGTNFRSWLFSIAHNVVIDVYRRRRPTVSMDRYPTATSGNTQIFDIEDDQPTPETQAIARDTGTRLRAALAHLPERQRSIIELRLAGLSHSEIAIVLGITSTAVRSAQFRGFTALRELLQPDHATIPLREAPHD